MHIFFKLTIFTSLILLFTGCESIEITTQNTASTTASTDNPLRVACVGDSITEGVGLSDEESYPTQLSGMLGEGYTVQNFGKESATVMKNGTLSYWNTSQISASFNYNPNIVVIMFGTNDARPENWENNSSFISDYEELIELYKNLPSKPIIYLSYPTPVYDVVYGITNDRIINEVIPSIRQVASNQGLRIIDNYTALVNQISLFPDNLHPNEEGARLIAEQVYGTIY